MLLFTGTWQPANKCRHLDTNMYEHKTPEKQDEKVQSLVRYGNAVKNCIVPKYWSTNFIKECDAQNQ